MTTKFEKIIKNIQYLGAWKESNLDYFFQEVEDDINFLRKFKKDFQYWNEETMKIHKEDFEISWRNRLKEKYSKQYCLSCVFPRQFSKSQKIKYLMMRVEIDKLLNINHINYQI